jgi:uncharacterized protein (DUF1800 family)
MGPRPSLAGRFGAGDQSALAACLAELEAPADALIVDDGLPSYREASARGVADKGMEDEVWKRELQARIAKHRRAGIGFVERLVLFWSNHFSMYVYKNNTVRCTIGHFERAVIRKHVLGTFPEMLKAVYQHPSMITYLDNQRSFGAYSVIAKQERVSYNENLARECLELHTVSGAAGYTQADIINVSKILTGWSFVDRDQAKERKWGGNPGNAGQFLYRDDGHDPGAFAVLGKLYDQPRQSQGLALLQDLALHPSTAENLAYKLLLHFVTDTPTPEMVAALKSTYLATNGDLKAVAQALIGLPEAWSTPMTRLRTPYLWLIGAFRALETLRISDDDLNDLLYILSTLNHAPWGYLTPDGFPDEDYYWMSPDAIRVREDAMHHLGWMYRDRYKGPAIRQVAARLFPGAFSEASNNAVWIWPDVQRAITVLFMTPEFLRR